MEGVKQIWGGESESYTSKMCLLKFKSLFLAIKQPTFRQKVTFGVLIVCMGGGEITFLCDSLPKRAEWL